LGKETMTMTEDKPKNNKGVWIIGLYIILCIAGFFYYTQTPVAPMNKDDTIHIGTLDEIKDDTTHIAYVVQNKKHYKIYSNSTSSMKKEITLEEYEKNTH
jgi:hypothetical protein